ncbi:MAG: DUF4838 domain-containing protein [Verrucomicrobia bacterium]|nr:DUF4838 domain-containing protein [Verrucomicrobiota bacterium]
MFTCLLAAAFLFPIVESGEPRASLVVTDNPPAEVQRATAEFQRVLKTMTGASLPTGDSAGTPRIHIGRDAFVEKAGLKLDTLDEDGFVIQTIGDRDLVLAGRNPHGTEFAVYRFLQKHAGVRWYFPTELGEVVPRRASLSVGRLVERQEPSFKSRLWSSAAPFDKGFWERHNLCRARYNFHHNLIRIFVPSKFGDQHMEWFPEINGQRKRPQDDNDHRWQPCFSNPEVARFAAEAARKYFDANPSAASFSLGINDTSASGFCECAACRALDPTDPADQKTPRGLPNYSNRFFTFMNRAAEHLAKTHPDKFIGCLAYHVTEPPPTFPVHPRVIPYLTAGRANWTDSAIRAGDQKLIRTWCAKVPVVGIYDYYYGSGFVSPRIFTGLTEESLKFAHHAGVRGFYAEIYSTWSLDGPKAWVASQLLWNVNQNAKELVDDFCRGLFGNAGDAMRDYFRFLEARWMQRPSGSTVMWAGFYDAKQLDLWPADVCAQARALLTTAERAAANDDETIRKRVRLYSDGFRQTELWSALYQAEKSLRSPPDFRRYLDAALARMTWQQEVINPHPLHRPASPKKFEERSRNAPGARVSAALLMLADDPDAEPLLKQWAAQKINTDAAAAARAALALRHKPEFSQELLANPDLESNGAHWTRWVRPKTAGKIEFAPAAARSGKDGVVIRSAASACVMQTLPAKPGEKYLATVYTRGRAEAKGNASLTIKFRADGKWLPDSAGGSAKMPANAATEWTRLAVVVQAPPDAQSLVWMVSAHDQGEDDEIHFDTASLKRLP